MSTLVPIFICVVLPVAIVAIIFATAMYRDKKRTEVLLKAIEANNVLDVDKLASALQKPVRSPKEMLWLRLQRGCVCTLIGVGLVITGIVTLLSDQGMGFGSDSVFFPVVGGVVLLAVGISYLIVYSVSRKNIGKEN